MDDRPGTRWWRRPVRLTPATVAAHLADRRGAVVVLLACVLAGAGLPLWSQARASARYPVASDDLARAHAALDTLATTGAAPAVPYAREEFGQAWADTDRNGCDTRNDVLRRDLRDTALDPRTRGCVVLTGTLDDPYTGRPVPFARGPTSGDVQVDHVVALGDAWRSGAWAWTDRERERFANDPANLLAVDGPANQAKGAADAADWLPPETGYRCAYAVRQVRVKSAYQLSVTRDERRALGRALDGCVVAR